MATEIATAYVSLVASAKGIQKSIEDEIGGPLEAAARQAGDKAGKGFGDRFRASSGDLTDFGKKGLAATAVLSAGLFGAAKAAAGLEAAISANEQVLGTASKAVQTWAKDSVDAVGLSERAAVEATTSFGQLAKVAGETGDGVSAFSIEMVQLAADMAAFKDVPVDQALADLQSGFAGSTEVLRKYAIFLDDATLKQAYMRVTGEEVTGVLTSQQRVIATHAEVMRQSADMQGQWGREADGLAGQQAKAKAELENMAAVAGQTLIPVFSQLVGWSSQLFGWFGDLNESTGGLVTDLIAFGTAGLGVASSVSFVSGKVGGLIDSISGMSSMSKSAIGVLGGLAVAATVAYAGYRILTAEQREIAKRSAAVGDALADQVTEIIRTGQAASSAAVGMEALNRALAGSDEDGQKLARSLTALGISGEETFDTLIALQDDPLSALKALAIQSGATADEAQRLAEKVAASEDPFWGTAEANMWLTEDLIATGKAMEELQDQAEKVDIDKSLRPALLDLAAASGDASLKLLEQAEATTGLSRNGENLVPLYQEFTRLLADSGLILDDTATATGELGEEQQQLGQDVTETKSRMDLLNASLKAQDDAASLAKEAADSLKNALDRLTGAGLNMEAVNQALIEGTESLTASVEENGATLDISTEKGRENRDVIADQVRNIIDMADALVKSGYSNETAATYAQGLTEGLLDQMEQLGFTRAEAEAYVAALGLTPESIDTAVDLAGDADAKARVEAMIEKLDDLDDPRLTDIKAAVDQGSYDEAERLLKQLERSRNISYTIAIRGGAEAVRSASGRFVPGGTNLLSSLAERPGRAGDEVVMPLGDPAAMRELWASNDVGTRIAAAVGRSVVPLGELGSLDTREASAPAGPLFGDVHISSEVELDALFRQAMFHLVGV